MAENHIPEVPFLRRSIPGEYFSLVSLIVAVAGGLFWSLQAGRCIPALALVAADGWIFLRSLGIWSGRRMTPAITGLLLAILLWLSRSPACPSCQGWARGVFSPTTASLLLGVFLIVDVLESRAHQRKRSS